MSRDKDYADYCLKAGIENRNTSTERLGSAMPPEPASPIRTAVELLDSRLSDLQATTERLFSKLKPVTTSMDGKYPQAPAEAKEGNSPLNTDINAMADRLGVITAALQVQVDRLEV